MKIVEEEIPALIRNQQDKVVLTHLYKELFPSVQSYIRKNNGIADDAHDVFQDALMYFYNQVVKGTFDPKYTVYGYVYRLAINRWINKLNKDKKIVFKTELSDEIARDTSYRRIGEDTDSENSEKSIIKKIISYLGDRCEELLTLRIYGNLMFEDIMLRMDFNSEAAAKMYFKRCREKLVDAIKANPALADGLRD